MVLNMSIADQKSILDNFIFRLIAIAAISLFVSELGDIKGLAHRLHTVEFYYEFGVTFLIAFVITELVYRINQVLNKKYPLHQFKVERAILQILLAIILPALLIFGMASLYFYLNGIDIFRTDYLVFAFPFVIVLLILLNLLLLLIPYFIWTFKQQGSTVLIEQTEEARNTVSRIKAFNGASVLFLEDCEILLTYIINGRVVIKNKQEEELLTDHTLDELEQLLPDEYFFRINRQLIASRLAYKGYSSIENGKIAVLLEPKVPVEPIVSQLKAKKFREWTKS